MQAVFKVFELQAKHAIQQQDHNITDIFPGGRISLFQPKLFIDPNLMSYITHH